MKISLTSPYPHIFLLLTRAPQTRRLVEFRKEKKKQKKTISSTNNTKLERLCQITLQCKMIALISPYNKDMTSTSGVNSRCGGAMGEWRTSSCPTPPSPACTQTPTHTQMRINRQRGGKEGRMRPPGAMRRARTRGVSVHDGDRENHREAEMEQMMCRGEVNSTGAVIDRHARSISLTLNHSAHPMKSNHIMRARARARWLVLMEPGSSPSGPGPLLQRPTFVPTWRRTGGLWWPWRPGRRRRSRFSWRSSILHPPHGGGALPVSSALFKLLNFPSFSFS